MGRRKIEIKAIKDDRNRSVTFLKRKGGLFKKAHELSVLCSVDVAVFVFGNNKKLYEYSSGDMRDLITKYQFHGGPSEHKGPSDYNGHDDDDDEEADGTPPRGPDGLENPMIPPQYHAQQPPQQPPFPQVRHHTPSASPPVHNGTVFPGHPHHQRQRSHTPQPRPHSQSDGHRMPPNMAHQGGHPGMTYMQAPSVYNSPQPQHAGMLPPHGAQYPYQPSAPQNHHQPPPYMEDRRPSAPPTYAAQPPPPPQPVPVSRAENTPPLPQPVPQHIPQISTTSPQPEQRGLGIQPPPPPPVKMEGHDMAQPAFLNTDAAIKKLPPQRKSHSIFTPVEENRSILSQHLDSFSSEPQSRSDPAAAVAAANLNRAQTSDAAVASRTSSPPRAGGSVDDKGRPGSVPSAPETAFPAPPTRTNSLKGSIGSAGGSRPRGPRLTVQIPDGGSEAGGSATGSNSPHNAADVTPQGPQRHNSHSSIVLPPPSPSASALLSAGATGPPNPFAKPPPQQNVNADTPASALPSRFLGNEFLPSPSSFYNDWNFRSSDGNTLPSPLNFTTPVAPSGASFLRDDAATTTAGPSHGGTASTAGGPPKRKSPDLTEDGEQAGGQEGGSEMKRARVD